jgi:hypothetical protein
MKPRAGRYAAERYAAGLKRWRRETRRYLLLLAGPFLVASVIELWVDRAWLPWIAGALFGAFAAIVVFIRDTPPRYVEQWDDGARGERKTEEILAPLEHDGWRVFHDVEARYGNYDHIAVGFAGVFLLETKNLQGIVDIRNGIPHLRRRHDPDSDKPCKWIPNQARRAAVQVKEDIERRTGLSKWVQAVVVFWSDFPEGFSEHDNCVFVHGEKLRSWLKEREAQLDEQQVARIATSLDQLARDDRRLTHA